MLFEEHAMEGLRGSGRGCPVGVRSKAAVPEEPLGEEAALGKREPAAFPPRAEYQWEGD